ncbi:MAG: YkoP family protein [Anaerolineales bacterium]
MMDVVIKEFDRFLRWTQGVYEFCEQPECLLRLKRSQAKRTVILPDKLIEKGMPILEIHLWNEHIPKMVNGKTDLHWAIQTKNRLVNSFKSLAILLIEDNSMADIEALYGITVLALDAQSAQPEPLITRLGFEVYPYQNRLGRFGEFWENFYTWWIMWAFNRASLRDKNLWELRRAEIWVSTEKFLSLYYNQKGGGYVHSKNENQ